MDNPADAGPFVIDPTGRDILGEAELIRTLGPVAQVEMPGGVLAWAVTDQVLLRRLLTDSRVSKDAYQHWRPGKTGRSPLTGRCSHGWPCATCSTPTALITGGCGD